MADKGKHFHASAPGYILAMFRRSRGRFHSSLRHTAYVRWMRLFIVFHRKRHPREMGVQEVQQFLTHLAVEGHVAASTQSQALSALLFL
jgi:hypothetical protein